MFGKNRSGKLKHVRNWVKVSELKVEFSSIKALDASLKALTTSLCCHLSQNGQRQKNGETERKRKKKRGEGFWEKKPSCA